MAFEDSYFYYRWKNQVLEPPSNDYVVAISASGKSTMSRTGKTTLTTVVAERLDQSEDGFDADAKATLDAGELAYEIVPNVENKSAVCLDEAQGAAGTTGMDRRRGMKTEVIDSINAILNNGDKELTIIITAQHLPMLDDAGNLDISDWKLRGNPVYNAFFTDYLGAQVIDLPTTDVYAALERGVVDATGWTQIGLSDLKWDDFVNYRIEPNFFSTDLGVIVNLETWEGLSEEARTILQETAIEHERESAEKLGAMADEQLAALVDLQHERRVEGGVDVLVRGHRQVDGDHAVAPVGHLEARAAGGAGDEERFLLDDLQRRLHVGVSLSNVSAGLRACRRPPAAIVRLVTNDRPRQTRPPRPEGRGFGRQGTKRTISTPSLPRD